MIERLALIACMSLGLALCLASRDIAFAAVDDGMTARWVERGFTKGDCKAPASKAHDLKALDAPGAIEAAWRYLKGCRDAGNSQDHNLAAAENYLFIRWAASETGDTGFEKTPDWYYTFKVVASKASMLDRLKTSSQPVSDPDPDVLRWGKLGFQHGIRDFEKRTGQKATLKTAAIVTVLRFLADRYY